MRPTPITFILTFSLFTAAHAAITGKVQTADGKPVAGAKVYCAYWKDHSPVKREEPTKLTATTDANGRFVFRQANVPLTGWGHLSAISEGLSVGGRSFAGEKSTVWLSSEPAPVAQPIVITLFPETTLEVRLVDAQGQPISGVKVEPLFLRTPPLPNAEIWERQGQDVWVRERDMLGIAGVSDAQGVARIRRLPQGGTVALHLKDDRFGTVRFGPTPDRPMDNVQLARAPLTQGPTVKLLPASVMEGVLRYEDGKPAANVRLYTYTLNESQGEATTDAQGRFRIASLPPGTYRLSLHYESEKSLDWTMENKDVDVAVGQTTKGVQLTLVKGGLIEGTVTDAKTGKPLTDVRVGASRSVKRPGLGYTESAGSAITDKDGRYRMRVMPGEVAVNVALPKGYLPLQDVPPGMFADSRYGSREGTVKAGETLRVDLKLRPAPVVHGRVADANGKPVPRAAVINLASRMIILFDPERMRADAQGRFALRGLNPLHEVKLRAYKGDLISAKDTTFIPDALGGKEVIVRVAKVPRAKVRGRVVDEDGKPVPKAGGYLLLGQRMVYWSSPWAVANEKGEFEISGLFPGLTYSVYAQGENTSRAESKLFTPKPGEVVNVGTLKVSLNTAISGRIVTIDGKPVEGARVYTFITGPRGDAKTDAQGRFRLAPVPTEKFGFDVALPPKEEGGAFRAILRMEVQARKGENNFDLLTVQPITSDILEVKRDKGELLIRLKPHEEQKSEIRLSEATKSEIEIKPLAVGMPAPELSCSAWLNDNGKNLSLAALRGRVVLLDFCDFFR